MTPPSTTAAPNKVFHGPDCEVLSSFSYADGDQRGCADRPSRRQAAGLSCDTAEVASFSDRFFMMARQIPAYLNVACELRFSPQPQHPLKKICQFLPRAATIGRELCLTRPSQAIFRANIERLSVDFGAFEQRALATDKPLCLYGVHRADHNGAIWGDHAYYYHIYKIRKFEHHFSVVGCCFSTLADVGARLAEVHEAYPGRRVEVIDLVSHGSAYGAGQLDNKMFSNLAPAATILLDACAAGAGQNSLAEQLASANPGCTVFAPQGDLYFSLPIFSADEQGHVRIDHLVHGFAPTMAFSARKFFVDDD